jgi:membrane protein DedA with SNARE-associated domain/rhodanese-related sulfurtransferase
MPGAMEFLVRHGYVVLFVTVLAEQIGLPVPSVPFLVAAGALAGLHRLSLPEAIALAVMASLMSDSVWFYLGKNRGGAILQLLCRLSLEPDTCVSKTRSIYLRHGPRTLLVAKFVPGLNTVASPMAGLFKLAPWKFLVLDTTAALLWAGSYTGLGWMFRGQIELLGAFLERFGVWMGTVVGVGLALYVALKYWQRQRIYRALRVARIMPEELKERMDGGEPLMIVDLRNAIERLQGSIPGATHLTDDNLDSLLALGSGTEIVLYCSCPDEFESARAALRLKRAGAARVRPLEGGFPLWRELGFPVDATELGPGAAAHLGSSLTPLRTDP